MKNLTLLLLILLFACSSSIITYDELVGEYEAKYREQIQYLSLHRDDTYIYRYVLDEEQIIQTGNWEYEVKEGVVWLTFFRLRLYDPTLSENVPKIPFSVNGFWPVVPVKSFSGVIILRSNEEKQYSFKKVS